MTIRIGQGFDLHRLEPGRPFMLGGVQLDAPIGPVGHSDGDVILHALTDALLGSLSLGDIGDWFPPSDPQWKNAPSSTFLKKAQQLLEEKNYILVNADITVILEAPKLGKYKEVIQEKIAELMAIEVEQISIKAKTAEGILAELGEGKAIACYVVALVRKV